MTMNELINNNSAVTPSQEAVNTYLATLQIFSAYKYAKPRNSMPNRISRAFYFGFVPLHPVVR
jgi:hypothetical protein